MIGFYGLTLNATGEIERAVNFKSQASNWLSPGNHNHLRITRIIRCLRLLGLETEAQAFYVCLAGIYEEHPKKITADTFRFWKSAANNPL
jgi:hypothetical protein